MLKEELEKEQLSWFSKKIIFLSQNTVNIPYEYGKFICFPISLLKEEPDIFPMGRYDGECDFVSEDEEYASYCTEMLKQIKDDIPLLKSNHFFIDKDEFKWEEDRENYLGYGYVFIIDYSFKELFVNYLSFLTNRKKIKKMRNSKKTSGIVFKCSGNKSFQFNEKTGDFIFGKTEGNLNPAGQEFNFLIELLSSDDYQSDYESLIRSVWPNRGNSSSSKTDLSTNVIKSLKVKLNILPNNLKNRNPNIFNNIKGFGYRLNIKQNPK